MRSFPLVNAILLYLTKSVLTTEHAPNNYPDLYDLSGYKQTIFLPYTSSFSSSSTPSVRSSINGKVVTFSVETSSTGLMIGAPLLPNIKLNSKNENNYPKSWQYLDSNSLLFTGRVVPFRVTFYGLKGQQAVSQVPVLVVQQVTKCPGYNVAYGNGVCPKGQSVKSAASPESVKYMGVGFGRNIAGSGRSFGLPDHNPFLNIISINGWKSTRLRMGYSLSTTGVHLGLTGLNTRNATWTNLSKGSTNDPRDWAELDMSFTVNGIGNYHGKALIDTGTPQMLIQSAPVAPLPNITALSSFSTPRYTKRVTNGTILDFAFPSLEKGIAGYDFVVGDEDFPSQPEYVEASSDRSGPFVNTGRNFLFGFTVLFDATGGRFGFVCSKCTAENGAIE